MREIIFLICETSVLRYTFLATSTGARDSWGMEKLQVILHELSQRTSTHIKKVQRSDQS